MTEVEELKAALEVEWDGLAQDYVWDGGRLARPRRIWETAYWRVRSFISCVWSGYYWRKLKNRRQRAARGWGDMDVWSLDSYLCRWLPAALRHLAKTTHGYPGHIVDANGSCIYEEKLGIVHEDEVEDEDGPRIWGEVLEKMALGFEAHEVLSDYGWHHESPAEKRLLEIRQEGMMLFVNNIGHLWD